MRLDNSFRELDALLQRCGATRSTWVFGSAPLDPIEILRRELEVGKEIPLAAVSDHGGLLVYEGEPVVLYILETRLPRHTVEHDSENSRRFHVAECTTLAQMRLDGRTDRYVASQSKTGMFRVTCLDESAQSTVEIEAAKLHVCRNCLRLLDWKAYRENEARANDSIWRSFQMDEFFATYETFFNVLPEHTDRDHPLGGYVEKWSSLSTRIRSERGWRCEECRVDLSAERRLLHCHHKDGRVWDNRASNIAVLCLICHAAKPLHGRIKVDARDRMTIEGLRAKQGLA